MRVKCQVSSAERVHYVRLAGWCILGVHCNCPMQFLLHLFESTNAHRIAQHISQRGRDRCKDDRVPSEELLTERTWRSTSGAVLRDLVRSAASHCSCASGLKSVHLRKRRVKKHRPPHTKHSISSDPVLLSLCTVCPHSGSRTGKGTVVFQHSTVSIPHVLQCSREL